MRISRNGSPVHPTPIRASALFVLICALVNALIPSFPPFSPDKLWTMHPRGSHEQAELNQKTSPVLLFGVTSLTNMIMSLQLRQRHGFAKVPLVTLSDPVRALLGRDDVFAKVR